MTSLEVALRGGSIAILLLFSVLCFRFRREFLPLRYAALYCLGSAAYTYSSAWPVPNRIADLILSGLLCAVPAAFWLLMASLFDDGFAPSLRKHAALAIMAAWGVPEELTHWRWVWLTDLYFAIALGFWVAGSIQAVLGFVDDLIQGRRQFRIAVLLLTPLHAFALIAVELLSPGASLAETGRTINSWSIAIVSCLGAIFFLRPHPVMMAVKAGAAPTVTARDQALLAKLDLIMTEERLYRDEGLTVASLAKRMEMGESRLRKLINTGLGHRNFSAFVNGYRLAEASAALADPTQAEVPILTIALDSGFGSIGPFNRAFKANTGLTPREFRNLRLGADFG